MAQWDFLNVPVDPFVPPAAAPRPPETCPLTRVVPYKSFKDPSNVTIGTSKTSPLTPWDTLEVPIDPLGLQIKPRVVTLPRHWQYPEITRSGPEHTEETPCMSLVL